MIVTDNTIRIPKPNIFSFDECLHFLDRGYDDCLFTIEKERLIKPLRMDGEEVLIAVSDDTDTLKVEILSGNGSQKGLEETAGFVSSWFDLDRDLRPFYQLLAQDSRLSDMAGRFHGLRLMGIPDLFEALCWCVIGQQINLTFAHRLKRRLVETYGTTLEHDSEKHYFFPEPRILAGLSVEKLKKMQFSRRKAEYTIGIARQFAAGELSKEAIGKLPGSKQMLARLKNIRGVGPWTANYVLMKSFQQPNCITYGDTGLQSAVSSMLDLDRKPTKEEVDSFFEPFAGWESYLNIYLWRILS